MSVDVSYQWVGWFMGLSVDDVAAQFDDEQVRVLASRISAHPLLNPPKPQGVKVKRGVFVCKYCGREFKADYKTSHPQYCSEYHRQLFWKAGRQ